MRSENAVAFLDISWNSGPPQSGTCAGNLSYAPTDLPSCFARCNSDLDLVECEQIRIEILDRFGGCMSACSTSEQNEFWTNRCDEDLYRCTLVFEHLVRGYDSLSLSLKCIFNHLTLSCFNYVTQEYHSLIAHPQEITRKKSTLEY